MLIAAIPAVCLMVGYRQWMLLPSYFYDMSYVYDMSSMYDYMYTTSYLFDMSHGRVSSMGAVAM